MRGREFTEMRQREISSPRFSIILAVLLIPAFFQACALVRTSRPSSASTVSSPPGPPPQVSSLSKPAVPDTKSTEKSKIKEEDLKEKQSTPQARAKDRAARPAPTKEPPPPVLDDSSLIAKITPKTPPQRAASLRLTDEGRKFIESGEYAKALTRLEKTIAIDSTNPYGYYYLAQAQFHLGRYQESLNFLDVAESLLANEPFWMAEVFALKGENFRSLGFLQRADSSYSQALRLNSGNRVAAEGLSGIRGESQPSPR